MPKISLTVPHALGQEKATDRLKTLIEHMRSSQQGRMGEVQESWEGNVLKFAFSTFGMKMQGETAVNAADVHMDLEIPFAAMMFKGKIEGEMREQLERILG